VAFNLDAELGGGSMQSNLFDLTGKVAIITGGAGLLGQQHAQAISDAGGTPILWDIVKPKGHNEQVVDVADTTSVRYAFSHVLYMFHRVDILINNAAHNSETGDPLTFEEMMPVLWDADLQVGLTGAFLCSQIIGGYMARNGGGVIVNIGSDFSTIAPNPAHYAPRVKPASYSVVKHGLLGLTKYLAAYWGRAGVRVNMLSPGGVENGQPAEFVETIAAQNPMGRMACPEEYRGAIQFLCSDASRYMTGHNLIMDGGRSIW
jgi:NAD(P)-dependent dehydrogenase (short-subunit alcohol dehydrogenase family)